jgi:hypothetical protein
MVSRPREISPDAGLTDHSPIRSIVEGGGSMTGQIYPIASEHECIGAISENFRVFQVRFRTLREAAEQSDPTSRQPTGVPP